MRTNRQISVVSIWIYEKLKQKTINQSISTFFQQLTRIPYLSVYGVVHHHSMIFDVVELVVDFHVVVLVACLDCKRLNFDVIFGPVIVSVNYLQPMVIVVVQPATAVSAADEAVVHVILLFFAKIVFAV